MPVDAPYLSPAEAARQLGISTKALRLYEQRRLLGPARTRTGWRLYGPAELARAQEIVALRALGLTLTQVAAALSADAAERAAALTAHQGVLEGRARTVVAAIAGLAELRSTAGAAARVPASARRCCSSTESSRNAHPAGLVGETRCTASCRVG